MDKAANRVKTGEKIWTKDFVNIFILNFVMSMGQFMMNTLIPKYAYELGAAASVVGMVTGAFAITALALRPIAGPSMDYFKKNRLLTFAIGLITLSFIVYGLAGNIAMLVAARLIHGMAMSVSAPLSLAIVCNVIPSEKMASGLGIYSLGSAVSTAVGPTVGLKLAEVISYNSTFFICAVLMATSFIISFQIKADDPVRNGRFRIAIKQIIAPEVLLPTLVMFFMVIAYSGINAFIAIYGGLNGVAEIGLYFTASALCMIFIRPISGRIADKYGHDKSIIPGLIIFVAALVMISYSHTLPMFILAGVITAFGFGASQPLIQTMTMQLVPNARRGAAGNTSFLGIDCAFLVGPTLAGLVITNVQNSTSNEILGFSTMFRVMILPVVIAMVIFWFSKKKLLSKIKTLQEPSEIKELDSEII